MILLRTLPKPGMGEEALLWGVAIIVILLIMLPKPGMGEGKYVVGGNDGIVNLFTFLFLRIQICPILNQKD